MKRRWPLPAFSVGGVGFGRGPEGVVFGLVDFTLLHVEESDETSFAVARRFKDDRRGGAHRAAEDPVTDFKRLAVAFADEEGVERVGVDANAGELMRVVSAEEGFEFGFVGWA